MGTAISINFSVHTVGNSSFIRTTTMTAFNSALSNLWFHTKSECFFLFFFVFFLIARRLSLVESKFSSAIVFPIKLPSSLFHRICYCLISVFSHGDIRNRFGNLFRPNNGWHYLHVDLHCSIARVL